MDFFDTMARDATSYDTMTSYTTTADTSMSSFIVDDNDCVTETESVDTVVSSNAFFCSILTLFSNENFIELDATSSIYSNTTADSSNNQNDSERHSYPPIRREGEVLDHDLPFFMLQNQGKLYKLFIIYFIHRRVFERY
jgi:hypothetical protein